MEDGDNKSAISLSQIRDLIITTELCSVTVPLLNELISCGVNVIVCDKRKNPSGILIPINQTSTALGNIIYQSRWKESDKKELWNLVVANKICNQVLVLDKHKVQYNEKLREYPSKVVDGDIQNCEGIAAKIYFKALFGPNFQRHADDAINHSLNYGYSILLSEITRCISLHGCSTALGVKHQSLSNPFNLACDFMEPFRPIVDNIIYSEKPNDLTWGLKLKLVDALQVKVRYCDKQMTAANAMENFVVDGLKFLSGKRTMGEVTLL